MSTIAIICFSVFGVCLLMIFFGVGSKTPPTKSSDQEDLYAERIELARKHAEKIGDTEALQAIANGTYNQLLDDRAAKRQQRTSPIVEGNSYNIAGINFRKGISNYVGRTEGYIKPEPTNRHDPNAIAVYVFDGHHLGYIPSDKTSEVRDLCKFFPIPVFVEIEECYDDDENRDYYVGSVTIKPNMRS